MDNPVALTFKADDSRLRYMVQTGLEDA